MAFDVACDTQLTFVMHEWAKVLNIHSQVDVIFLDFAKAFDSVPHVRLLLKACHATRGNSKLDIFIDKMKSFDNKNPKITAYLEI